MQLKWRDALDKLDETISGVKFDEAGLIPAICVDAGTRQVLMMAYMDKTALRKTIETGKAHFWSRSRKQYWMKGETSGHTQQVKGIYIDCDADTLLIEVDQTGAACHKGYYSCFYRRLSEEGQWQIVAQKVFDPQKVYKDNS